MCGLYTNTAPFYIRDFSILRLWYPCDDGVLELIFHRCQWDDYVVKMLIFTYHTYSAKRSQSTAKRWASLVAQWWRVCLPMQEPQVRSLIWKDPTCCWAAKPVDHNYWACALEPGSCNYWACAPQRQKPPQWEAHTPQLRSSPGSLQSEKSTHCNKDPEHLTMNKEYVKTKNLMIP